MAPTHEVYIRSGGVLSASNGVYTRTRQWQLGEQGSRSRSESRAPSEIRAPEPLIGARAERAMHGFECTRRQLLMKLVLRRLIDRHLCEDWGGYPYSFRRRLLYRWHLTSLTSIRFRNLERGPRPGGSTTYSSKLESERQSTRRIILKVVSSGFEPYRFQRRLRICCFGSRVLYTK